MDGGFLNMVIIISILGEEIMVQQGWPFQRHMASAN